MNELIKKPLSANMATELLVPSREQNGMIEWTKRCALGGYWTVLRRQKSYKDKPRIYHYKTLIEGSI